MPLTFHKRPALVVYVTCGDPDLATTREIVLAAIEAGADVIELGVPFSDPVADGPVIQRASERALKQGTSLGQVLTLAAEVRQHAQSTGVIIFSYFNPILRMGMEKFCKVARAAGLDGALVTDLPVEEAGDYLRSMRAYDLAPVFLAAPTSPDERLQRIAERVPGFCLCGIANRSDRSAATTGGRRAEVGAAAAAFDQIAGRVGIRHFDGGAVRGSGRVRGCGGRGQRDCGDRRAESRAGGGSCGGVCERAYSCQPSAVGSCALTITIGLLIAEG